MAELELNKDAIRHALQEANFSQKAELSQLVIDWPRVSHIIHINGQPLSQLFKNVGIIIDPDLDPLDSHSNRVLEQFKTLLSPLIANNIGSDKVYQQLASVLHQGGLPFMLETEISKHLNNNDLVRDNTKRGMTRRVDLISTDTGFIVKELFTYKGNLSRRDPDNPLYLQEDDKIPLITGKCEYHVRVDENGVKPVFQNMLISSSDTQLQAMLSPEDSITVSRDFKTRLHEAIHPKPQLNTPEPDEKEVPCLR